MAPRWQTGWTAPRSRRSPHGQDRRRAWRTTLKATARARSCSGWHRRAVRDPCMGRRSAPRGTVPRSGRGWWPSAPPKLRCFAWYWRLSTRRSAPLALNQSCLPRHGVGPGRWRGMTRPNMAGGGTWLSSTGAFSSTNVASARAPTQTRSRAPSRLGNPSATRSRPPSMGAVQSLRHARNVNNSIHYVQRDGVLALQCRIHRSSLVMCCECGHNDKAVPPLL
jgi:hypothetical protein